MRNIDTVKISSLAGMIIAFVFGYAAHRSGSNVRSAAWAMTCAGFMILFVNRLINGRYVNMPLHKVDQLSGNSFEMYLAEHFRRMGYRVKVTEGSHDYGADLILKKHKELIVVQAKRYDRAVGLTAVQEVIGAVGYYEADRGMVITNNRFTKNAFSLAKQNDISLWGRQELIRHFGARE